MGYFGMDMPEVVPEVELAANLVTEMVKPLIGVSRK